MLDVLNRGIDLARKKLQATVRVIDPSGKVGELKVIIIAADEIGIAIQSDAIEGIAFYPWSRIQNVHATELQ